MIDTFKSGEFADKPVSILTDAVNWQKNFGAVCSKYFSDYNLTYINLDSRANFNDWSQYMFGGWSYPTEKIYDQPIICGEVVGLSYQEV